MAKPSRKNKTKRTKPPRRTRNSMPAVGIPLDEKSTKNQPLKPASGDQSVEAKQQSEDHLASSESLRKSRRNTQAGDLTALSKNRFSAGESVSELLEEGQDLEGQLVEAVGAAGEASQKELPVRTEREERIPDYKNRNRL
jgi:hypothetical protein